jgi:hypothetical protein
MFNLKQVSISIAAIAATLTINILDSTTAQAAIISGQVTGTWQYDYDGAGGFNVGDAFTAEYTYDSDNVTTYDYSDPTYWSRYLVSSVPLLSLVLNSGTVSQIFDFNTVGSKYLQWHDIQAQPTYYGQYGYKQTYLYAEDYSLPDYNYFNAYSLLGQYSDGSPWSGSYALAYSYDTNTGTYSAYGYTYDRVTFSTSSPTAVPTPALLPGLLGLGISVVRRRKQADVEAVAE